MAKPWAIEFYQSRAWEKARDAYFRSRCGICERCGQAGDIVHHRIHLTPSNIKDPRVALSFDNLELLCQDCHNKEHFQSRRKRYRVDERGVVLPPVPPKSIRP